jgi:hypothetical protein
MPVIAEQVSIPANGVVNILNSLGSIWEFPDRNYYGRLAATGDAAFSIRLLVQAGDKTHLEESRISGANRVPILPDDLVLSRFPVPRSKRLVLRVRNTTAGAITFFFNLHLDPA